MRGTMAVFLAGGRGSELGVLSEHRAPAAVPFAGKYRLVDFSLSNCHHSEIFDVALITQHAPTSLNEHVRAGRPWDLDRATGGVRSLQAFAWRQRAAWYGGPAEALLRNLREFEQSGASRVIVGSAEHVYLMDYSQLVASHTASHRPVTLAITPWRRDPARPRRGARIAGDRLERLLEPADSPADAGSPAWASMGVFVFDLDFLRSLSGDTPPYSVHEQVESLRARGVPVHVFPFDGFWEDLDRLDTYFETSLALLGPSPPLPLSDPLWPVETRGEEHPPARFLAGCQVRSSLVAAGAVVAGEVHHSILFGGAVVEAGARVSHSIVFPDARIGAGAVLDHAVVDKLADIGDGAVVGDGPLPVRDRGSALCVVGKEARIEPGSRLARGSVVPVAPAVFLESR